MTNLMVLSLISAVVIFICIGANRLSNKLGIPTLLLFILLGMAFGSEGIFKIPFDNYTFAEGVCSFALLFIIFYGGFGTRWSTTRPVAVKAMLLSSLGTILTSLITALFCKWILHMSFINGLLLGSVLGSTDAASVFFILRSKRLNLKEGCAPLLEMESGSNDPFAYMMTILVLTAMQGKVNGLAVINLLASQIVIGIVSGVLIGLLASFILDHENNWGNGIDTIFVFGIALLAYALPSLFNGNGYLSAYIAGIILGNHNLNNKKSLVHFFDALTGLMQMILFFLLGLLAFPSQMKNTIMPAFIIALVLTFISRPASVRLSLMPYKIKWQEYIVIAWAGLRGAASIVFAIIAVNHPASAGYDVFHIVFCVVLFSILIQGTMLPVIARWCHMIDDNLDAMRTFNDYTEERQVQFVQTNIDEMHPWVNCQISEIEMLPNVLIAVLVRNGKTIVPSGRTQLLQGDMALLCTEGIPAMPDVQLREFTITGEHRWCNKRVHQTQGPREHIIIMVKRNGSVLIPDGDTILLKDDIIVAYVKPKPCKKIN